ncbi:mevalonate kinase [Methanococcus voltae]|uniref:Mevalonate kinase n=1 Tax=Methanococcus voltae (strain ATCC BAA-1334 / A3) TaxID=456320 RepID=D7DT20_METV3|nr:mevalonate kinase [Methanococcus voltae]MCS3901944.1 mevalonate kinase [Methanococcus voltae]
MENFQEFQNKYFKISETSPSKIILFGEHAVVDGYPAISMAIDLKTFGTIKKLDDCSENCSEKYIKIDLQDLNEKIVIDISNDEEIRNFLNLDVNNIVKNVKYVVCAIKNTIKYMINNNKNKDIKILPFELILHSETPVSCGLGSSASAVLTTIKLVSKLLNKNLNLSNSEMAEIAYSVEKEIQGRASITDTYTVSMGGILEIINNEYITDDLNLNDNLVELIQTCNFLIVYVEERNRKTAELVQEVGNNPKKEEIFSKIGEIISKLKTCKNKSEFGNLMTQNHNLLKDLNISTQKIDEVVELGSKYGLGAKLTGAGGGGCAIILLDDEELRKQELIYNLKKIDVMEIFECKMYLNK